MKKRPFSPNAACSPTPCRPSFFNRFTRKGLGIAALSTLLLVGHVQQAAAVQRIVNYRHDVALGDLTGYVIAPLDYYYPSRGNVMAGNVQLPGYPHPGQAVHYMLVDTNGNSMAGMVYQFPELEDVRVVSIAYNGNGNSVLTMQARENGTLNAHILSLKVDMGGNIIDQFDIQTFGQAGAISFPQHSLASGDQLYICGYQELNTADPLDPSFSDSRQAFVMRIDMPSHTSTVRFFNTNIIGQGYFDYDAAMRLKMHYGNLFVLGSANGPTSAGGIQNSSKSWVATIDQTNLTVYQSVYYGFNSEPNSSLTELKGAYAIDLVPDQTMDAWVIVNNDLSRNRWFVTHSYYSMVLQNSFAGFNAFTAVPQGHRMKASNIFCWSSNNTPPYIPRYSVCGTAGSDVPLNNPSAYGSLIEFTSQGAIPFVQAYYFDPFAGANAVTGVRGSVIGNAPGFGMGLDWHQPFWNINNMGAWNNRSFTTQPYYNGVYPYTTGLAMAGHVRGSLGGNINPRHIAATGDGEVINCDASQPMAFVPNQYFNVNVQPLAVTTSLGTTLEVNPIVDLTPQNPESEWECAPGFIYREAKPGTLTNGQQAPGLYPNPATDRITIVLGNEVQAGETARVLLTDITGRVVFTFTGKLNSSSLELALPRLTPGMYQVAVAVAEGQPVIHKLVIQ